jgi:peroxiredoxin
MPRRNRRVEVGDAAPYFELNEAAGGRTIRLTDYRGSTLVLVFGRGTR